MKLSARNQLQGTVSAVKEGVVNGIVAIDIGGQSLKSDITMEAIRDLDLTEGKPVLAIIKASNVMMAASDAPLTNLSARNQFVGVVKAITKGAVNGHVTLDLKGDVTMTASITNEAIEDLGLAPGQTAVAIVKATDVLVGVE